MYFIAPVYLFLAVPTFVKRIMSSKGILLQALQHCVINQIHLQSNGANTISHCLYLSPRGYSTNFYTGRLRPEVQPLTLLYTIFHEKVIHFVYSSLWVACVWPVNTLFPTIVSVFFFVLLLFFFLCNWWRISVPGILRSTSYESTHPPPKNWPLGNYFWRTRCSNFRWKWKKNVVLVSAEENGADLSRDWQTMAGWKLHQISFTSRLYYQPLFEKMSPHSEDQRPDTGTAEIEPFSSLVSLLYVSRCYLSVVITSSGFPWHKIIFYQPSNTIAWLFERSSS